MSGALMLAMALFLLGSLFLHAPWLYQEKRFHPQLGGFGVATPARRGRRVRLRLVAVHRADPRFDPRHRRQPDTACGRAARCSPRTRSASGLPFLVSGLALGRVSGALAWVKRHFPVIVGGSAVVLGAFGLLLDVRRADATSSVHLQRWLIDAHLEWLVNLG